MKIIFLQDVKKQGKKDEIKEVKDGYANYLISQKLAVAYTQKSMSVLNEEIKQRQDDENKLIEECNQMKKNMLKHELVFKVKTGEQDKVFGSISSKQISEELKKIGFDVDKKKIKIDNEINTLGTHIVNITLHKKVIVEMKVILKK